MEKAVFFVSCFLHDLNPFLLWSVHEIHKWDLARPCWALIQTSFFA